MNNGGLGLLLLLGGARLAIWYMTRPIDPFANLGTSLAAQDNAAGAASLPPGWSNIL
jgi:hypothetical protein